MVLNLAAEHSKPPTEKINKCTALVELFHRRARLVSRRAAVAMPTLHAHLGERAFES